MFPDFLKLTVYWGRQIILKNNYIYVIINNKLLWQKVLIIFSIYSPFLLRPEPLSFICPRPPEETMLLSVPCSYWLKFWPMGSNWKWYTQLSVNTLRYKGLALCCVCPFLPDGAAILDYDVEASCWERQGNRTGGARVRGHCGSTSTSSSPPTALFHAREVKFYLV